MRRTSGFTIIELVAVIVILGILAAVALPKYLDLSASARTAACQSWKGTIEGGSAINYASRASGNAVSANGPFLLSACSQLGNVVSGGLPTTVSINGTGGNATTGGSFACTIELTAGGTTCSTVVNVISVAS